MRSKYSSLWCYTLLVFLAAEVCAVECVMTFYKATLTMVSDVFLTTMKPLQKVVTAQDIESSLYYVHVDSAKDDMLRENIRREQDPVANGDAEANTLRNHSDGIQRKALPLSPQSASENRPELPTIAFPYFQPPTQSSLGSPQVVRALGGYGVTSRLRDTDPALTRPGKTISGPRPMYQPFHRSADGTALDRTPERQNVYLKSKSERLDVTGPPLPPRPVMKRKDVPSSQSSTFSGDRSKFRSKPDRPGKSGPQLPQRPIANRQHFSSDQPSTFLQESLAFPEGSNGDVDQKKEQGTSLTLIRRYNDCQWNVGKISTNVVTEMLPSHDVGLPTRQPGPQQLAIVSLEILTPAYSRFMNLGTSNIEPEMMASPESPFERHKPAFKKSSEEHPVFRRQIKTLGVGKRSEQHHRGGSTSSLSSRHSPRPSLDLQRTSHQSENDVRSDSFSSASQGSTPAKASHFTFQSPWDGVCEFDVSIMGGSLKCKHILAAADGVSKGHPLSAPVSELRFNLPRSNAFVPPPKSPSSSVTSKESKRSSFFSNRPVQHSPSYEAHSSSGRVERMDLSLGQELAGGGFGGKQAKLGKLIIENEGLKMLDLVVAANMGLWWRVYEKFM